LGFWPTPVELQALFAVLQLEHGDSLLQRIWSEQEEPC